MKKTQVRGAAGEASFAARAVLSKPTRQQPNNAEPSGSAGTSRSRFRALSILCSKKRQNQEIHAFDLRALVDCRAEGSVSQITTGCEAAVLNEHDFNILTAQSFLNFLGNIPVSDHTVNCGNRDNAGEAAPVELG